MMFSAGDHARLTHKMSFDHLAPGHNEPYLRNSWPPRGPYFPHPDLDMPSQAAEVQRTFPGDGTAAVGLSLFDVPAEDANHDTAANFQSATTPSTSRETEERNELLRLIADWHAESIVPAPPAPVPAPASSSLPGPRSLDATNIDRYMWSTATRCPESIQRAHAAGRAQSPASTMSGIPFDRAPFMPSPRYMPPSPAMSASAIDEADHDAEPSGAPTSPVNANATTPNTYPPTVVLVPEALPSDILPPAPRHLKRMRSLTSSPDVDQPTPRRQRISSPGGSLFSGTPSVKGTLVDESGEDGWKGEALGLTFDDDKEKKKIKGIVLLDQSGWDALQIGERKTEEDEEADEAEAATEVVESVEGAQVWVEVEDVQDAGVQEEDTSSTTSGEDGMTRCIRRCLSKMTRSPPTLGDEDLERIRADIAARFPDAAARSRTLTYDDLERISADIDARRVRGGLPEEDTRSTTLSDDDLGRLYAGMKARRLRYGLPEDSILSRPLSDEDLERISADIEARRVRNGFPKEDARPPLGVDDLERISADIMAREAENREFYRWLQTKLQQSGWMHMLRELFDREREEVEPMIIYRTHDDEVDPAFVDPDNALFGSLTFEEAVPPESTWGESPETRRAGVAMIYRNMTAFGNMDLLWFHMMLGCEEGWCPCGA
ncbi:unnamed protein product [Peniophora sp. CBMAI 1063]|nr:unnamed protein product [Peniophora sp. CBMAI 1063]